MRSPKRVDKLLMTPGPVSVRPSVQAALSQGPLFHRSADFENLFESVRTKLHRTWGARETDEVFVLSGSGTLAVEAALTSSARSADRFLVLSNGDFGERIATTLAVHGIEFDHMRLGWGDPIRIEDVERAADRCDATALAVVALETSTGMRNPVTAIGRVAHARGAWMFVDAVSALGGERLSMSDDGIEVCASVSNKGLEAPPGLGLVCVSADRLRDIRTREPRSVYLDLRRYADHATHNQTPTTPAIPQIMALDAALDDLLEEGIDARADRYRRWTDHILGELEDLGVAPLIADRDHRSNGVLTLCLPQEVEGEHVVRFLDSEGITIWRPRGTHPLSDRNTVQVAVMGPVGDREIRRFLVAMRAAIGAR